MEPLARTLMAALVVVALRPLAHGDTTLPAPAPRPSANRPHGRIIAPRFGPAFRPDGAPYWKADAAAIDRFERGLRTFLADELHLGNTVLHADTLERVHRYSRQYLGITFRGHRGLFVNLFCIEPTRHWERAMVDTLTDGGDCFIRLVLDLETGRYEELSMNGPA
jgi:hypothetical protein